MELQDGTPETKVHAITLRRSRRKATGPDSEPRGNEGVQRAARRAREAAAQALDTPRQTLRAALGLASILVKGGLSVWQALVREGTAVEATLRTRLRTALRNAPLPLRAGTTPRR
jgi:hypothetical protein